jgi:anti-sigma factor RsiW
MNEPLPQEIQDLHAFVDGQLAPDARQRVKARLAADPQMRRQVEDYAAIGDGLRALYGPLATEPVPAPLARRAHQRPRPSWRPWAAMAASVALLVAGGFMGAQWERGRLSPLAGAPHVVREAAMAYAVYAPEVRHPVEVPGDQEAHLVAWLTKRMGVEIRVPQLASLGLALVGGRLLSSDDGPGALLMYEDAEGRRLVLYACENPESDRSTAFRFGQAEGVSVFHWLDGPLSYALAGELDRAELLSIAEVVYRQLSA